jgi:NADH-quinone oxidoreductase subunit E
MAVRRLALEQPASFAFSPANKAWCDAQIAKYPAGRQASAVIPLLWKAQAQNSYWLPRPAIETVAGMLAMPYIRVLEIATFYSMFNLEPVGKFFIQLCGTTPCMLRGANDIRAVCEKRIGGQRKPDAGGMFAWAEVECLGACCNAPMVQINDDYYEDLDPASFNRLLDDLSAGRPAKKGSQTRRISSEPMPGPVTTLMETSLFDGSTVGAWKAKFEERVNAAAAAKAAAASPASGLPTSPTVAPSTPAATPAAAASATPAPPASATSGSAPVMTAEAAKATPAPSPHSEERAVAQALAALPADATPEQKANAVGQRPAGLATARAGQADDLKRVKGIGQVNESKLNALGVFHFDQIAQWSRREVHWVGAYLSFPGRIDRENWQAQAAVLAKGGDTDFSKRVDKGEVPTSTGGAARPDKTK